ncbi:MAG: fructose-6-phosphate aldolase [Deltaproteobacteria bacterium]|nr:fructose-6-phosphate aldolase [Deltaproteobacteria bacterium]
MDFFLDTALVDEIRAGLEMGMVDGITTNPSLVAKTGKKFMDVVKEILDLVPGPVSIEAVSEKAEDMIAEARDISGLGENAVVKIPMTEEGLKAVRALGEEGISTNVTLVFSPLQALMAAKAGASYVSPFVGRLDDVGEDGMSLVSQILEIFDNYMFETEVIVASVRTPTHVLTAARLGADIVTLPYGVLKKLPKHPLTDVGIAKFLADWEKVPK